MASFLPRGAVLFAAALLYLLSSCGGGGSVDPSAATDATSAVGRALLARDAAGYEVDALAQAAPRERAAAATTGPATPIYPNQPTRLISYAYVTVPGCQLIESGTLSTPTAPQHGVVTIRNESVLFSTGLCAGNTYLAVSAYYTWTDTQAPPGTTDTFTLHYSAQGGAVGLDTTWTFAPSNIDQTKALGGDPPLPPEPAPGRCGCSSDGDALNGDNLVGDSEGARPEPGGGNAASRRSGGGAASVGPRSEVRSIRSFTNTAVGNKLQVEADYEAAPHTGIGFTRYYNSKDPSAPAFGVGWRSQWNRSIHFVGNVIQYTRENGRIETFLRVGPKTAVRDPDVTTQLNFTIDITGAVTAWQVIRDDDSTEVYTSDGRLASITTRSGRVTTLAYDSSNRLISVTGPFGHKLQFTWSSTFVSQMTAPDGGVYQFGYDAAANLTSVRYPDGAVRRYVYEDTAFPHALTGTIDELGARYATFAYDASGRVISSQRAGGAELTTVTYNTDGTTTVFDARGFSHTRTYAIQYGSVKPMALSGTIYPGAGAAAFAYDNNGFTASTADWNGNVSTYLFDGRGNQTAYTEASGTPIARTITQTWHPTFRLPTQVVLPTQTVAFTYDSGGNALTRTVSASGQTRAWAMTYSALGQLLSSTDPLGRTTRFAYDAEGGVQAVTNALGQQTLVTARDANGRPALLVDPNGLTTTLAYDLRGRLLSRNVGGLVTGFTYDAAGNLLTTTNPDGSRLSMAYDAAHRLMGVTDSLGNRIAYTLDANGNRTNVAILDPSGALSRSAAYGYDDVNRPVRAIGAQGQTTTYSRDRNGNVTSVTDPVGAVTRNLYDALDRAVQSTDALGGVTTLSYDTMDRLVSVTDPRQLVTTYAYNGFGDLLTLRSPDTGTSTHTVDAMGNVVTSTDARGATVTTSYDALNRPIALSYAGGGLAYQYDAAPNGIGRLRQVSGTTDTTTFGYDLLGRLVNRQQQVGGTTLTESLSYNAGGQLVGMTYPSGMQVAYQYDAAGQVAALSVNNSPFLSGVLHEPFGPASGWSWAGQTYQRPHDGDGRVASYLLGATTRSLSYDAASQITGYRDSSGATQSFAYDLLGRLTQFTLATDLQQYGYDPDGNRTSLATGSGTTTYGISATSNALLTEKHPAAKYVYDAAGNLTANGSLNFSYDALGRMVSSLNGPAKKGGTLYTTNGLGQRVQKSGPSGTTTFLYRDGGRLLGEYGSSSSQETIYLDGMPVGLNNNGAMLRIYADQLGAPRVVADAAGAVLWSWDGDPFGNVVPTASLAFNQRFPGQYFDVETGLHYNMARYYDPKIGRYIQSDLIGLFGGINSFSYVTSRPTSRADRVGLLPDSGGNVTSGGFCVFGCVGFTVTNPSDPANRNWYLSIGGSNSVGPYTSTMYSNNPDGYTNGFSLQGSLTGLDATGTGLTDYLIPSGDWAIGAQTGEPNICLSHGTKLTRGFDFYDRALDQWGNQFFFSLIGLPYGNVTPYRKTPESVVSESSARQDYETWIYPR